MTLHSDRMRTRFPLTRALITNGSLSTMGDIVGWIVTDTSNGHTVDARQRVRGTIEIDAYPLVK